MPLRLVVSLILFLVAFGAGVNGGGVSVCLAQMAPYRRPSPTPTPPTGGPNTGDIGGAGRTRIEGGIENRRSSKPVFSPPPRSSFPADISMPRFRANPSARRVRSYRFASRLHEFSSYTCDPTEHEQEDLTGTYTGNIDFPSRTISGSATLNIEGHRFTLSAGDVEFSGDVSSVTTCNYTAVAIRLENPGSPADSSNGAESISLKAIRMGSSLTLTSVEGQTKFQFTPPSRKAAPGRTR